jgi:predicted amidohydrolase YtcJ
MGGKARGPRKDQRRLRLAITALSLDQALRGYTKEAAYAEFEEKRKASIEPGMLADFTVIDKDITRLASTPKEILFIRVLKTFVGGKLVYDSDSAHVGMEKASR